MTQYELNRPFAILAGVCLAATVVLTVLVTTVDIRAIGPQGSAVGLATLNGAVFSRAGVHTMPDKISDILLIVTILVAAALVVVGIVQAVRRRSLFEVDRPILLMVLAGAISCAVYILFNVLVLNYAPSLDEGQLKASFPSSHVLLCTVVFGCAMVILERLVDNRIIVRVFDVVAVAAIIVMPVLRILAGAHWATDVIVALLFGLALVLYVCAYGTREVRRPEIRGRHARL